MSAVLDPIGRPIGNLWIDRTEAERTALITPTDYQYPPGDVRRYGISSGNSAATNTTQLNALTAAFAGGQVFDISEAIPLNTCTIPARHTLRFNSASSLAPASAQTVTISGGVIAGERQQIFSGAGSVISDFARKATPFWWGAAGDGTTNDQTKVQAAITFAGAKGTLFVNGRFLCSSGITLLDHQTVQGESFALSDAFDDTYDPALYSDQTSGVFITTGETPVFSNVTVYNTEGVYNAGAFSGTTCTGIQTVGSIVGDRLKVYNFQYLVELTDNAYYARFVTSELFECLYCVRSTTGAYNLEFVDCRIDRCNRVHYASVTPTTQIKVIGGSVENYKYAFDQVTEISCHGTYFETSQANSYGFFDSQTLDNVSVALFGCTVYMNNMDRFVNFSGRSSVSLSAHGNKYHGDDASATGYVYYLPSTGNIDIGGDCVTSTWNAVYTINQGPEFNILYPLGAGFDNVFYRGMLSGSATYDPANLVDGAGATTTVTVTGASLGDQAIASFSNDLQGILLTAWVSGSNTVSVRFQNETAGAIDLASGTLRARVMKG